MSVKLNEAAKKALEDRRIREKPLEDIIRSKTNIGRNIHRLIPSILTPAKTPAKKVS